MTRREPFPDSIMADGFRLLATGVAGVAGRPPYTTA